MNPLMKNTTPLNIALIIAIDFFDFNFLINNSLNFTIFFPPILKYKNYYITYLL